MEKKYKQIRFEEETCTILESAMTKLGNELNRRVFYDEIMMFIEALSYEEIKALYIKAFNQRLEDKGLLK